MGNYSDLKPAAAHYGSHDPILDSGTTASPRARSPMSMQLPRRRMLLQLCGAAAVSSLANCSEPGSKLPELPDPVSVAYHLGANDRIRVITLDAPELTGEFFVNDSGNIALPQIGTLPAAGLTPKELEQAVTARLKQMNLLRDPSVSIEVVQYRPIFVLGEVNKPGQYPYQPGMTTVTAVAVAGGFTYRAVVDRFSVVRTTAGHAGEGRVGRQAFLQPGDVLTVYERIF